MPGLRLYTGNRLEILAEQLARLLDHPLSSPLEREIILVQSRGMERWISMELARHHGICANCSFPFPNRFAYTVFRDVIPDMPAAPPLEPAVLTWKIMEALPPKLKSPEFESLRNYLSGGAAELKLFQLAQRIADLFDQYLLFRPEMILDWERGNAHHWQAILWREVSRGTEGKHAAALQEAFRRAMARSPVRLSSLPERISVFGISALPPFHIQILGEVSKVAEVNLFLMNPCREYWGDLLTERQARKLEDKARQKNTPVSGLHLGGGNPLLASMGMLGRDFFDLTLDFETERNEFFVDPGEGSLLSCIQSDILNLRTRPLPDGKKKVISAGDHSIQVHSCHTPMREVEILQDRLLALFESDPALLPKDILVMTPDVGTYSPFFQAVFSVDPEDPRWIPFSIADRGVRQESLLADVFLSLLEFHGSRFGVSQVMAVLESPDVQKKFSIREEDLECVRRWVKETRIRWGIDQESRGELGLPAFHENTWRAGLERMLLGYALPGNEERLFKGILPYDLIEGGQAAVLGNLAEFAERLFALKRELEKPRGLKDWGEYLNMLLDEFFLADDQTERDIRFIRRVLAELGEKQELSGFRGQTPLSVIQAHLRASLEREGFGHGFLTGGVTFCAMLPMRSIPFRVICLLGMNDDAYPRQTKSLGFDLLAKHPRPGDRSRRHDDRYLFLESILSARDELYISYVGQGAQDNRIRPPSVLVSELLDCIEEGFEVPGGKILEHVVTPHRLQAFSPDYFKGGKLLSYSAENFDAARELSRIPRKAAVFIPRGLPDPGQEWKEIELEQLCRFYGHPARFLLNQRLGIYLDEEEALYDLEPFELHGLERYQLEQELVRRGNENANFKDVFAAVKASGQLPHGAPGECLYRETCRGIEDFLESLKPYRKKLPLEPLAVDLRIGEFRILGRVEGIYPQGLLHFRYANVRPRDRLRMWIHHLVLNMAGSEGCSGRGILICKEGEIRYPPLKNGGERLRELLEIFREGLKRPIHFFPLSSWTYMDALSRGKKPPEALRSARDRWEGSDFSQGERKDPYYQVCFGGAEPFDEEFAATARKIFGPLLDCEEKTEHG